MTREDKLARRIGQGDADAAEELIRVYYPEILKYCLWHTPNRTLAEDAAQETFLKAIRYMDRYVSRGKFRAFLYKIAANTCIDMGRKKWTAEALLDDLEAEPQYMESGFDQVDEEMQLRRLVRKQKEKQQITSSLSQR